MKRLLLLAALIASSFAFTACETHVVDHRRPAYYSDRPYYNRSQVVVHRGYDDDYHQPSYRRGYYGGSGYHGGSSYRSTRYVSAPTYSRTRVVYHNDRRGRYHVQNGRRIYVNVR